MKDCLPAAQFPQHQTGNYFNTNTEGECHILKNPLQNLPFLFWRVVVLGVFCACTEQM